MKNNADIKRNFLTQNEIESLLKAANTGSPCPKLTDLTYSVLFMDFAPVKFVIQISDIDLRSKCIYIHLVLKVFHYPSFTQ
ncbi:hypothetical protein DMH17_07640 [Raoultella planticola]|nr:hypothetical protein [Raoultella planticola]